MYVTRMDNPRDMLLYDINASGRRFDLSHTDCQIVVSLLGSDMSDLVDFLGPSFRGSDAQGFMPVILLPPVSQCCGYNLLIHNRPSHARVYTTHGTDIARVFTRECRNSDCQKHYHYSYMESGSSSDTKRYHYSFKDLSSPTFK